MLPKEIPDYIEQVMEYIEIGIQRVAGKIIAVEPPAGVDPPMVHVAYPDVVEIMLNVDAKVDDGTKEGCWESQTLWVKIPWPQKIG